MPGLKSGRYAITPFDTAAGAVIRSLQARVSDTRPELGPLPVKTDLAVAIQAIDPAA